MFDIIYAQNNSEPSIILSLLPFALMFLIVYFILIRPESQKRKQFEEELNSLQKGDAVVTRGGIIGKVVEVKGKNNEKITLLTEDGTKITVLKSYYSQKYVKAK